MQVDLLSAGGGAVLQEGAGPGGGASEVACLSAARSAAPDLGAGTAKQRGAARRRAGSIAPGIWWCERARGERV